MHFLVYPDQARDILPDVHMERLDAILSGMDSETEAAHYHYGRHAKFSDLVMPFMHPLHSEVYQSACCLPMVRSRQYAVGLRNASTQREGEN